VRGACGWGRGVGGVGVGWGPVWGGGLGGFGWGWGVGGVGAPKPQQPQQTTQQKNKNTTKNNPTPNTNPPPPNHNPPPPQQPPPHPSTPTLPLLFLRLNLPRKFLSSTLPSLFMTPFFSHPFSSESNNGSEMVPRSAFPSLRSPP